MKDADCVAFLQWALPALGLSWQGFRKPRRQVCRRIAGRAAELGLPDLAAYRARLEEDPEEWRALDRLCRVTISRFFRDRGLWALLEEEVLPELAAGARARGERTINAWSAGCASGEEPYTLAVLWALRLAPRFPQLELRVLATDLDEAVLSRARTACYPPSALREVPPDCRAAAFEERGGLLCLNERFRGPVTLRRHDVRTRPPSLPFDIALCRNVAFTYFAPESQRRTAALLASALVPGGALVLGAHERLPGEAAGFEPWPGAPHVYRRAAAS